MPPAPLVSPAAALTPQELERYARHVLLPGIGVEGQRRLKGARVLVVGAGGLGSPVLLYLAAAGVGTLGVVDADVVDVSNLQRQVVHTTSDVGRPKTSSAADAVARANPLVDVVPHDVLLTRDNALELVGGYDVVVDGTDRFPSRYLVNDACVLAGVPCVWGSVLRFEGQASIWWPGGGGPCYRCVFPTPPAPGEVPSCAEGGVLGALCGVVGSVQAAEVVKLVTGSGDPLVGRLLLHDALRQSWDTLPVRRNPACARCGEAPTMTGLGDDEAFCGVPAHEQDPVGELAPEELWALLQSGGPAPSRPVVVDVRTPLERSVATLDDVVAVGMDELRSGAALPAVPADRPVVVYCASGVRSAEAAAILRAAGHRDVRSLRGGLAAWQRLQVDRAG